MRTFNEERRLEEIKSLEWLLENFYEIWDEGKAEKEETESELSGIHRTTGLYEFRANERPMYFVLERKSIAQNKHLILTKGKISLVII